MCDAVEFDIDLFELGLYPFSCPSFPSCDLCFNAQLADDRSSKYQEIEEIIKKRVADFSRRRPASPPPAPKEKRVIPKDTSVYELTLTTDEDNVRYLVDSLNAIVKSAMFGIYEWRACIELTESGLPHIHAILFSNKKYCDGSKIKTKFKKRYEFKRVIDIEAYENYIKKMSGNNVVSDYCAKHGVNQFMSNVVDGPVH